MVREFLELCSGGGEVRRSWPVPSKRLGEGAIQPGAFLFFFLLFFKQTLSVNRHITSTSVQPSDLQDSLLLRVGCVKTKH